MNSIIAIIKPLGAGGLVIIEPLSAADPGFGNRPPVDPGYGRPGFGLGHPDHDLPGFAPHPGHDLPWGPGHPEHGLPGQGHPAHPLPVPPPDGVVTPPIVLPDRPNLLAGAGIVVPLPSGATVPAPKTPPVAGTVPYVLWFGPGSASSVVYLPPQAPAAAPK